MKQIHVCPKRLCILLFLGGLIFQASTVYQNLSRHSFRKHTSIRKILQCNIYPHKPHFYVFAEENVCYFFFLFLTQNIECVPTIYVLSKNKKNITHFLLIFFFNFYNLKTLCTLHGQVFIPSFLFSTYIVCQREQFV